MLFHDHLIMCYNDFEPNLKPDDFFIVILFITVRKGRRVCFSYRLVVGFKAEFLRPFCLN